MILVLACFRAGAVAGVEKEEWGEMGVGSEMGKMPFAVFLFISGR